nr:gluconate 2-dehydrogenase subunit 3 family protein [uncultured Cohaesibacter sp.]
MTDIPRRVSRRGFLMGSAASAAFATLMNPSFSYAQAELPPLEEYEPVFFNADEWRFVMAACDRLIPAEGDGPGALETRVPVFIDLQMKGSFGDASDWYMAGPHQPDANPLMGFQSPLTPAEIYRQAIPAFQDWCQTTHGDAFENLDAETKDSALTALQKGEVNLPPELRDFFSFLLQNTKEGYFADPKYGGNYQLKAWAYIGFPGARAAYTEWVTRHNQTYPLPAISISGERA